MIHEKSRRTNAKKGMAMLAAAALLFGFGMVGCSGDDDDPGDGPGGNTDPKTLVINGISAETYAMFQNSWKMGLFPVGTTPAEALALGDNVPGALSSNSDITKTASAPYTVTIPLYNGVNTRWTGNGTYDIGLQVGSTDFYMAKSVAFTTASTTISADVFKTVNF